ncbi:MAG: alpha/beta hydrolase [bacterium]|nr:alpha/beta hydrolase [bacterium]
MNPLPSSHDAQAERRAQLYGLLGDLPDRQRPIDAALIARHEREGFTVETLLCDLNGIEPVPAYFIRPNHRLPPYPVIVYNHAHGGDYKTGKEELLTGRPSLQNPPFGTLLAHMGCAALCIDHWCFGERRGRSENETFKTMLWRGQVLWGMMVYDSLRAVDYLTTTRNDIDPTRIGTLGLSMGSTMAWWLAALDTRIRLCIDLCCLTDYDALIESRGLELHGVYYYVPALLKHFTTAQINALIAPRPHLSLQGNYDPLTPPHGLDVIDAELTAVYAADGNPNGWQLYRSDTGHYETAVMRQRIIEMLSRTFHL